MGDVQQLADKIIQFIEHKTHTFNELALELFAYQFNHNAPYQAFCTSRGSSPKSITDWTQIPCVPTTAFKKIDLVCAPKDRSSRMFVSSGTTHGLDDRSRHYVFSLDLYETSSRCSFAHHILPDTTRLPILVLFPSANELPHSSLAHMLSLCVSEFGGKGSGFFIRNGKLLADELASRLIELSTDNLPVVLLGTSFSFVHFLDHCSERSLQFALKHGSRLMDTGGFKGKSREIARDELYQLYESILGIDRPFCVNEYGMCEMSSQFYDGITGHVTDSPRSFIPPPWVRTAIVHPETLDDSSPGEIGMLRHYDLANHGSVMAIQTEDLGRQTCNGFEVIGRAEGSELKGCSLLTEELLEASP